MIVQYVLRFKSTSNCLGFFSEQHNPTTKNKINELLPHEFAMHDTIDSECILCLPLNIKQSTSNVRGCVETTYDNVQSITHYTKIISRHGQNHFLFELFFL